MAEKNEARYIRLARERHARDLKEAPSRGFFFDRKAGERVCNYFEKYLRHWKGEWAGELIKLGEWQREDLLLPLFGWKRQDDGTRRFRYAYVELPRKNGKSTIGGGVGLYLTGADGEAGAEVYSSAPLALDTPVPTPKGWTTQGELRIGDEVFDENGQICRVTYLAPILYDRDCYEVEFEDGTIIVSDANHRWLTDATTGFNGNASSTKPPRLRCESGRKAVFSLHNRRHHVCAWRNPNREALFAKKLTELLKREPLRIARRGVRTTAEIARTLRTPGGSLNHRVDIAGSLCLQVADLPIDPYTLGVWLGDGRSNRGSLCFHKTDRAILDGIYAAGYDISAMRPQGDTEVVTIRGLRTQLRCIDLLGNKRIPRAYLRAAEHQRLALLRGLMDTDGTCTKSGECRFTNRNEDLARGVFDLVCGLGMRGNFRTVSVADAPHYVVSFKACQQKSAFGLRRKAKRQRSELSERVKGRYIVAVRPAARVPVRCVEVDSPSHLYLVSSAYIATHNTKKDQARIVFNDAQQMVRRSPELRKFYKTRVNNIHCPRLASKFEPLGADQDTLDGLNVHGNIIDELHAHKNRGVYDVLVTATGARRQPLTFMITTAGLYDTTTVGWSQHDYTTKVLEGVFTDDSWFGYIAHADKEDDWTDPEVWRKANPNLGISVKERYLADLVTKAKQAPEDLNSFLRYHLNIWTEQVDRVIDMDDWRACGGKVDIEKLIGQPCFGGLDLASTIDIAAWCLFFPLQKQVLWRFYVPEETILQRSRLDRVPYDAWKRDGFITATPGNVIDYEFIRADINLDADRFRIKEIAFDPWNATQICTQLMGDGLEMVEMRQGFPSLTAPTKELLKMIRSHAFNHGDNPVATWMASNMAVSQDPAGNLKPDKGKAKEKIDGMVAQIMALGRSMVQPAAQSSIYESGGLLVV